MSQINNRKRNIGENKQARMSLSGPTRAARSTIERRSSLAPSHEINKRMSIISQTNSRLSIIKPNAKKDPRPIKEKQFQTQCISIIYNFLTENEYPQQLTNKTLLMPSSKDFQMIFKFIYSFIDPSYDGGKKFEDDVLILLKGLRYPFVSEISKSQLYAVGSMHSWPSLLAMLFWLTEIVISVKHLKTNPQEIEETREKLFFDYLGKTYKEFLHGENEYTSMLNEFETKFNQRNSEVEGDVSKLRDQLKNLEKEINKAENNILNKKKEEKKVLDEDVSKMKVYLEHLKKKTRKFEESTKRGKEDLEKEEEKHKELGQKIKELQKKIDAQKTSPEDIDRMNNEKESLEIKTKTLAVAREELERGCREKESVLSYHLRKIEEESGEYLLCAKKAGLSVERKDQDNVDVSLIMKDGIILDKDLKKEFLPRFIEMKEKLSEETASLLKKRFEQQQLLETLNENMQDKEENCEEMNMKNEKLTSTYSNEKTRFSNESTSSADKIEELDILIQKIKTEMTSGFIEKKQHLQKLRIQADTMKSKFNEEKEKTVKKAYSLVSELINFKTEIESTLAEMETSFVEEFEKYI